MKKVSNFLFIIGFFIPSLLVGMSFHPVFAQDNSNWVPQQRIPGYENSTWPPILISDSKGTVHAFSYQWLSIGKVPTVRAIMYNRWTLEQGWTAPVAILMSPLKNDARLLDAFIDQTGRVHVIFWGGDNTEANIYYSSAPIFDAGNAKAWSVPILVAENAADPETGVFATDERGGIFLLFGGNRDGNGVYATTSYDNGATWKKPTPIYLTQDIDRGVHALHLFKSESGRLHTIWNVVTGSGQGRKIYYSQMKLNDSHWSSPILLAEEQTGYGTNTPAIIEHRGIIYALYNTTNIITMRRSYDDGQTWGNPVVLFPKHVGVSGNLSLVTDGNDNLHLFFAQRIPGITLGPNIPDIGGMWHSVWDINHWIEPEAVAVQPDNNKNAKGNDVFSPFEARAVVSHGNIMLIAWMTDPGIAVRNGVWYTFKVLDTPEHMPEPLPTVSFSYSSTSTPLSAQPVSPSPAKLSSIPIQTEDTQAISLSNINSNSSDSLIFLIISLIPVFLIIGIVLILNLRLKQN